MHGKRRGCGLSTLALIAVVGVACLLFLLGFVRALPQILDEVLRSLLGGGP